MAKGGPFTRVDPANTSNKSCLGLVIVSANLMPFITELVVDKDREFTPYRFVKRGKSVGKRFTDHYSLICLVEGLPPADGEQRITTKWNLKKPGGWESYKIATDETAEKIDEIIEVEQDIEEVMRKFEKLQDKAKFKAFNKTKIKGKKSLKSSQGKKDVKELLKEQSEKIEKEILDIKQCNQGRCSKVFQMKSKINGSKISNQEAHAIKDPKTGDLIVAREEIKIASLEYNCDVLKNNEPEEGFKDMVEIKEKLHDGRMLNKIGEGSFEVKREYLNQIVKKFKDNKKATYDFLVKGGEKFKGAVFRLCKRMIEKEEFPSSFESTILNQIYKGKGSNLYLSNSRFIHLKKWLPRTCDALVVGGKL